jgi:tape measure domain-containing protein
MAFTVGRASIDFVGNTRGLVRGVNRVEGVMNRVAGVATRVGGILSGVLGGVGLARSFQMAARFEQTKVALEGLTGSAEKANKVFRQMQQFGAATGFRPEELLRAVQLMTAMGFQSHRAVRIVKTLADTMAALGQGTDDLRGVTRALVQIQQKGRLSAEEMNQLGERGIDAAGAIAKAFDTTKGAIRQSLARGVNIRGEDVIPIVIRDLAGKFGGEAERQADTLGRSFARLTIQLDRLGASFARGLSQSVGISRMLGLASNEAEGMMQSMQRLGSRVGELIAKVVNYVKENGQLIATTAKWVAVAGTAAFLLPKLARGFAMAATAARSLSAAYATLGSVNVAQQMQMLTVGLPKQSSRMARLGQVTKRAAAPMAAMGKQVGRAAKQLGFWSVVVGGAIAAGNTLVAGVRAMTDGSRSFTETWMQQSRSLANSIPILSSVFDGLKAVASGIGLLDAEALKLEDVQEGMRKVHDQLARNAQDLSNVQNDKARNTLIQERIQLMRQQIALEKKRLTQMDDAQARRGQISTIAALQSKMEGLRTKTDHFSKSQRQATDSAGVPDLSRKWDKLTGTVEEAGQSLSDFSGKLRSAVTTGVSARINDLNQKLQRLSRQARKLAQDMDDGQAADFLGKVREQLRNLRQDRIGDMLTEIGNRFRSAMGRETENEIAKTQQRIRELIKDIKALESRGLIDPEKADRRIAALQERMRTAPQRIRDRNRDDRSLEDGPQTVQRRVRVAIVDAARFGEKIQRAAGGRRDPRQETADNTKRTAEASKRGAKAAQTTNSKLDRLIALAEGGTFGGAGGPATFAP